MEQSWRWFGPGDVVPLRAIRQAGASGVVTSLHQIPYGELWTEDAIAERQALITTDQSLGLRWNVVESLPIHERIKLDEGDLTRLFDSYRQSLRNLAAAGVKIICYNFMPVVDWTRTELYHELPGGGRALRFNAHEYAAFDCFMLERQGAEADHPPEVVARGRTWFAGASESQKATLLSSIMAGLPGAFDRYDIPALRLMLERYKDVSTDTLRERLARFLREVVPTAEEVGIRMAIHPDDPPRPLMGLPRIVSSTADLEFITRAVELAGERHHVLHRVARCGCPQRRAGDGAAIRQPCPFRTSTQRRQGGRWLFHGGGPSWRRHRHGGGGGSYARRANTAPGCRRRELAPSVPTRPRP